MRSIDIYCRIVCWYGAYVSCLAELAADSGPLAQYRGRDITFSYPSRLQLAATRRGADLQLRVPSTSKYWQDTIIIRKYNKKTEECDLPQDCHPDSGDNRKIAGRVAYAYSGEDAAMNRYVRRKGYFIEDKRFCWNFELIRTGRPYQKFDLSRQEIQGLDKESELEAKNTRSAFNAILNTFALAAD